MPKRKPKAVPPARPSADSSSSDEDENIAMLRAATDASLITDDMFKNVGATTASDSSSTANPTKKGFSTKYFIPIN